MNFCAMASRSSLICKSIICLFIFCACNTPPEIEVSPAVEAKKDTIKEVAFELTEDEKIKIAAYQDSVILPYSEFFKHFESELTAIDSGQFNQSTKNYKTDCDFEDFNVYLESYCDEICETFLVERDSGIRLLLPADYDAGVLGTSTSQNCNWFIVYGSYDGADYDSYYRYRSEFHLYKLEGRNGLKAFKPAFTYHTKEWSIEDLIWKNDSTLLLKLYKDDRWGDGKDLKYYFFRTSIKG